MNEMSEETKREANEKVNKSKREMQVLQILSEYRELTATHCKEVVYQITELGRERIKEC